MISHQKLFPSRTYPWLARVWVVARGPMLTDEPGSGKYRAGYVNSEMGRTLSRENFADFMLKQIESDEWLHKMPAVSDR